MPDYMTQKMSSGALEAITYYRKQTGEHVSHKESSGFTTAAKNAYAAAKKVAKSAVEEGTYRSGQGIPTGGTVKKI